MTTRAALFVALIGLVIAAACAIPIYFIGNWDPAADDAVMSIIFLDLVAILGVTILLLGLVIAGVTAFRAPHQQLS